MDGRKPMALASGSTAPYYLLHRGGEIGGSGLVTQTGGFNFPSAFRPSSNPNLQAHSNVRPVSEQSFSAEPSNINFDHGMNIVIPSSAPVSEPVRKKRGRPRKYAPDGQISLGLSPLPGKPKPSSGQDPLSPKRPRGRPRGTGRKQQLALLGNWMNNSAGMAFAPHVISVGFGEDIAAKILSFAQRRSRALCVLSGTGTVSSVTLRQPASPGPTLTFEGCFEILCLSGSYLVSEDGGPRSQTGGISASLASPDGHVIGGAIGMLIAAGPVQVVACSFVQGDSKNKQRPVGRPKIEKESASHSGVKSVTPKTTLPANISQNFTPSPVHPWPVSRSVDPRNLHDDIDLMRG